MKRAFYITCFAGLGFIVQFLIHGILENFYIRLLISDFSKYSFGLTWETWVQIHKIGTSGLLVAGLSIGLWQGFYWWPRLYTHDGKRRNLRV